LSGKSPTYSPTYNLPFDPAYTSWVRDHREVIEVSYNALRIGGFSLAGREYLLTAVTHHRRPVFKEFRFARLLARTLHQAADAAAADWLAWVIMPDHFHGLLALGADADLAALMHRAKGSAARAERPIRHHGPLLAARLS
jgi:REP element-mobilizing transposase RayT